MAQLVYIPSINPNTWLHLTHQGEATCLRDYSKSPDHAPVPIRNWYTYSQFQSMLSEPGNMVHEDVPFRPHPMTRLWHQTIRALNLAHGLPGTPCGASEVDAPEGDRTAPIREDIGPGSPETMTCPKCGYSWPTTRDGLDEEDSRESVRLPELLKMKSEPFLERGDEAGLAGLFNGWIEKLRTIVRMYRFNHYDTTDAKAMSNPRSGIGWTATILEHCREDGSLRFIDTGDSVLDFALTAVDVNLGIRARRNPFRRNHKGLIELDGLGVRRDGTFCVLEVKAERDTDDLEFATWQAVCGALAIYAKRSMIVEIAREQRGRRPAVPIANVLEVEPSLGAYVLMSIKDKYGNEKYVRPGEALGSKITTVLRALPQLREVVYFSVNPYVDFPSRIAVDRVFRVTIR